MQKKLKIPEQFELSFRLAKHIGWRAVGHLGQLGYVGDPPRGGGRRAIPNYFDRENAVARAELLDYVRGADLQTKVLFIQALDRDTTGGVFMSSISSDRLPLVDDVLQLLTAQSALVAWALVEAAGIELEEKGKERRRVA